MTVNKEGDDHGVTTARDLDTSRILAGNCMENQQTGSPNRKEKEGGT